MSSSSPPLSQLLLWFGVGAVISLLCFGAATAWALRRPAGSVRYKTLLAGTAVLSIALAWVVPVAGVAVSPMTLLWQVVGNAAIVLVLSRWFGRRTGTASPELPIVGSVEPSGVPTQPARRVPVPPAAQSIEAIPKSAPGRSGAGTGAVFISYRRIDSSDVTGRIYDRLVASHGRARVFKDVDSIPLGTDFRHHVADLIAQSDCVLVVIGRQWLDTADAAGLRRLDNSSDLVRIEIESALARGVPVIPLLVQGAEMPTAESLPEALRPLTFRNGMSVRPDPDFHRDLDRLDEQLRILSAPRQP